MENSIHIGTMLRYFFRKKRVSKAAFSRAMQVSPTTTNYHLRQADINTAILLKYCEVLKHNFFMDIAQQLPKDYTTDTPPDTEKDSLILALQEEVKVLKIERDLLKGMWGK